MQADARMQAAANVLAESATMRRTAILLESLRREVEDAERGSGHRDRQLQHSSERAAATVSLRSMEASGGAGHEDHVIPSRAKLGGRRFQLGVLRPKPFRTLRSNVPRRQTLVPQAMHAQLFY